MSRFVEIAGARRAIGGFTPGPLSHFVPTLLVGAALLGITVVAWMGLQKWTGVGADTTPRVAVLETQAPASPVSTLDRVYLSTRIANPGDERLENLAVELSIVGPNGQPVLQSRQRGIALDGHDVRSVYWAWRVPDGVAPGTYQTGISVKGADGDVLGQSDAAASTFVIEGR